MEVLAWIVGVVVVVLCAPWVASMFMRSDSPGSGSGLSALGDAFGAFDPGTQRATILVRKEREKKAPLENGDDEDTEHR